MRDTIFETHNLVTGVALDAKDVLQRKEITYIHAFQYVRKTGEVTPAGWQPGKPTLTPGPELAGKVWKIWKPDTSG